MDRYSLIHDTKAASDCFSEKYQKYTIVRTCIKKKIGSKSSQTQFKKKVARICRLVIAIRKGVAKANNPTMLMENGGPLKLSEDWGRVSLKSLEWTERKGTTG